MFAQTTEREPGRFRRGARRVGRTLRHEYAVAIYGSLLLAIVLTWPTLRYPLHTVPQDIWDPARQAWQISWAGHVLLTDPARLWQANAFYPEHYSFAFGDSLLGYAPAGMLGEGPFAAVLRYNILFVLAHALLTMGGYALVRQLGAGRTAALVGAVAFAYAPWRLAQEGHLDILSAGGIPLALAMLARGHGWSLRGGFRSAQRRTGWAVAGWAVATWQLTLGFSLGLPFAYALGLIIVVVAAAVLIRWLFRLGKALRHRRQTVSRRRRGQEVDPGPNAGSELPPAGETTDPKKTAGAETTAALEETPSRGKTVGLRKTPSPDKTTGLAETASLGKTASLAETASLGRTASLAETPSLEKTARLEKADGPETADGLKKATGAEAATSARAATGAGAATGAEAPAGEEAARSRKLLPDVDETVQGKRPGDKKSGKRRSVFARGTASGQEPASRRGKAPAHARVSGEPARKKKAARDDTVAMPAADRATGGADPAVSEPAPAAVERVGDGPVRVGLGWRLLVADLLGVLIFVGVGALIAVPYFRVAGTGPAGTEISFFSAPVRSLLIGPAESRIWGVPHEVARGTLGWPAEMTLLPGFVLYALALVGLVFSVWRVWQRLALLGAVVVSAIFTLGTTFFEGRWTYLPLFGHLPASFGVRIPGRLMLWVTLLLAILAAGAVAEFVRRAEGLAAARVQPGAGPGPWLRMATFVPLALVLLEGWNATAHPVMPVQPAAMRTVQGPMLVLPTAALADQTVLLWSTTRFQDLANGAGGFAPLRQAELRRSVASFPDEASIRFLRSEGIGTVVLLRSEVPGTSWARAGDLPVDNLGITREDLDDESVLFRLN
ncbi:hypothetical protein [Actinoplanes sp. NPDC051494]|uniref:hypothetical protein n=1 Tax=Actinoplanes sp. NPDC051494 TaxID=3363907 RepID=UPI0037BA82CF